MCPLCSEVLAKESDVWIQTGGSNTLCYSLAWVCKNCGTAWAIALTGGGLLSKWKQLWQEGERAE